MTKETIAIIDLGTNTFHLMIAEVDERDDYVIKGKYKEPVKLGEGGLSAGRITDEAYKRGIEALKMFRTIIDTSGIVRVLAFATSAIRSSSNGLAFIEDAKNEANIPIKTINGNEEASIIFEGVRNGVQLPFEERALVMDIGGGSVEFIVAHEGRAEFLRSINIGGARLLDKIKPSNPITTKELATIYSLFEKELVSLIKELKEFDLSVLVGSSGTFESIATLTAYFRKDKVAAMHINGYRFERKDFEVVYNKLIPSTRQERMKIDGMDGTRVDMIVLGACLVNYVIQELNLSQIMVSTHALKEGILHRYMRDKKMRLTKFIGPADRNLRVKAVQALAIKFQYEQEHVLKVSELATMLFDFLEPYHHFGAVEKELLQYAAILHDIGKFVQVSGHHKHSQYIVANSNLSGFNTTELLVLSNIVRYHRRAIPKIEHQPYAILLPKDKKLVQILAGILRIADNLDRGHRNYVTGLKVIVSAEKIQILVQALSNVDMEIKFALENSDLLEEVMARKVEIRQEL